MSLCKSLESRGFIHAPNAKSSTSRRIILEVFPHAALVALFDLDKIIKYKKGSIAQKRFGLERLRTLVGRLRSFEPRLAVNALLSSFLARDLNSLRGQHLKNYEDAIDAIVCAYLAYYYWVWREERTELFGDIEAGYILNPRLLAGHDPG